MNANACSTDLPVFSFFWCAFRVSLFVDIQNFIVFVFLWCFRVLTVSFDPRVAGSYFHEMQVRLSLIVILIVLDGKLYVKWFVVNHLFSFFLPCLELTFLCCISNTTTFPWLHWCHLFENLTLRRAMNELTVKLQCLRGSFIALFWIRVPVSLPRNSGLAEWKTYHIVLCLFFKIFYFWFLKPTYFTYSLEFSESKYACLEPKFSESSWFLKDDKFDTCRFNCPNSWQGSQECVPAVNMDKE